MYHILYTSGRMRFHEFVSRSDDERFKSIRHRIYYTFHYVFTHKKHIHLRQIF